MSRHLPATVYIQTNTRGVRGLSGGFTPCRHLRPPSGREHTVITYSVRWWWLLDEWPLTRCQGTWYHLSKRVVPSHGPLEVLRHKVVSNHRPIGPAPTCRILTQAYKMLRISYVDLGLLWNVKAHSLLDILKNQRHTSNFQNMSIDQSRNVELQWTNTLQSV